MAAIVVEHVSKAFRRGLFGVGSTVHALQDVSFEVSAGEAIGIIGPNGAGKTTMLGCLLGFLRPDQGRVTVDGREPDELSVRARTGYLPERLVMDRWMSGSTFLRYHHALGGLPAASRRADCAALLDRVGLDPAARERAIGSYSRGMLQRIGVAQALLGRPQFVFLDEPISGVDPSGIVVIRGILEELRRSGATLVINSHQLDEVERLCDRIVFVRGGRVEALEVIRAGAELARRVRVRFSVSGRQPTDAELAGIGERLGSTLVSWSAPDARFQVKDDAAATALLGALIAAGWPVVEASAEESRLERLFSAAATTT
ncbi:MAG: ABC transporter ATP-binding protein [Candidatus Eisenbacteria bacterium]|uniref:ABC transporter ATP-binding protein n=1 Tax=Eiseniibacteriota bacterium TaxID=2212470 RepID=A0A849SCT1_UNCEI|nr:ABC transporter ATP-binding protein [Candidatus Eisenbacteria bacterium]